MTGSAGWERILELHKRLFGTDGVRGIANRDLTPELALRLGRAVARVAARPEGGKPTLLVAKDTRVSCDLLEAAVTAGVCSAGADVLATGVLPSPAVSHLTGALNLAGGLMVSASHNPYEYNGIKVFGRGGGKLSDAEEAAIEAEFDRDNGDGLVIGREVGRVRRAPGLGRRYAADLMARLGASLEGMRLVVDCANGSLSDLAPRVFRELGADVEAVCCRPTGTNINEDCGALHPAALSTAVLERRARAGVTFDGDGDRVLLLDERGAVVDGDQILAMCCQHMQQEGPLNGGCVVGTVLSNRGLEEALQRMGCRLIRTQVGDRYVIEEMERTGALLGGETCGHLVFRNYSQSADGLLASLVVLRMLSRNGRRLSELASIMRRYPQATVSIPVSREVNPDSDEEIRGIVARVEAALGESGRVVIRRSGTEPVIRIMAEGPTQEEVQQRVGEIAEVVARLASAA